MQEFHRQLGYRKEFPVPEGPLWVVDQYWIWRNDPQLGWLHLLHPYIRP